MKPPAGLDTRTPEEILYDAVCTIAAVGEDLPEGATMSAIELMWGAMVREAADAKARVDRARTQSEQKSH